MIAISVTQDESPDSIEPGTNDRWKRELGERRPAFEGIFGERAANWLRYGFVNKALSAWTQAADMWESDCFHRRRYGQAAPHRTLGSSPECGPIRCGGRRTHRIAMMFSVDATAESDLRSERACRKWRQCYQHHYGR